MPVPPPQPLGGDKQDSKKLAWNKPCCDRNTLALTGALMFTAFPSHHAANTGLSPAP